MIHNAFLLILFSLMHLFKNSDMNDIDLHHLSIILFLHIPCDVTQCDLYLYLHLFCNRVVSKPAVKGEFMGSQGKSVSPITH